jgi:hypothetical protein
MEVTVDNVVVCLFARYVVGLSVLSDCRHKAMVQCRGQREGRLQVERYLPSSKIDLIKFRQ